MKPARTSRTPARPLSEEAGPPASSTRPRSQLEEDARAAGIPTGVGAAVPAVEAAAGAVAGMALGALAGPAGAVAGAAIGGAIGAAVGVVEVERHSAVSARDAALDEEIGVTSGAIGLPPEPRR